MKLNPIILKALENIKIKEIEKLNNWTPEEISKIQGLGYGGKKELIQFLNKLPDPSGSV